MFCLFCLTAVAANPVLVGTWPGVPRGDALAVAVSGAHAYVAAGDGGVLVIDISNPAAPAQVGGYLISGEALAVAVSGNYAYVVADIGGLLIINVSNPTAPALAGTYLTDADPLGVAVSGKRAYVTYENRLEVVDVTNPATPLQTARPCFSPRPGF